MALHIGNAGAPHEHNKGFNYEGMIAYSPNRRNLWPGHVGVVDVTPRWCWAARESPS